MSKSNFVVTSPRVSSRTSEVGTEHTRLVIKERREGRQASIPFSGGKRYHSYQLEGAKPIKLADFVKLIAQASDVEAADILQQIPRDAGKGDRITVILAEGTTCGCKDIGETTLTLTATFADVVQAMSLMRMGRSIEHRRFVDMALALETQSHRLRTLDIEEWDPA